MWTRFSASAGKCWFQEKAYVSKYLGDLQFHWFMCNLILTVSFKTTKTYNKHSCLLKLDFKLDSTNKLQNNEHISLEMLIAAFKLDAKL